MEEEGWEEEEEEEEEDGDGGRAWRTLFLNNKQEKALLVLVWGGCLKEIEFQISLKSWRGWR